MEMFHNPQLPPLSSPIFFFFVSHTYIPKAHQAHRAPDQDGSKEGKDPKKKRVHTTHHPLSGRAHNSPVYVVPSALLAHEPGSSATALPMPPMVSPNRSRASPGT